MDTTLQNIDTQRSSSKQDFLLPLKVLGGFFAVALLCIGVYGNFPLNDDWMYGLEVQRMLETGQLHLYGGSPSCALHIIIATIVCKLFGFSFVVLRSCGLVFGFACSFLAWAILRQLGISNKTATLAAFVLASNPLFLNLTFGYMTDLPALTFCFAYILFFILGMKKDRVVAVFTLRHRTDVRACSQTKLCNLHRLQFTYNSRICPESTAQSFDYFCGARSSPPLSSLLPRPHDECDQRLSRRL